MPTGQQYKSNVPQTTNTGVTIGATAMTVASSSGWPTPPFTAVLDLGNSNQEVIQVTAVAALNWTIVKGQDTTADVAHSNGSSVTHSSIARDFREARAHLDATVSPDVVGNPVHNLASTSAVVGTIDTQTLTNKTLTSPTLNTATVNDPVLKVGGLTVTIPAATDTLVNLAGTQTLTNKTLTTPVLTTPTLNGGIHTGTQVFTGSTAQDMLVVNSVDANLPLRVNARSGTSNFVFDVQRSGVSKWTVNNTDKLVGGTGCVIAVDPSLTRPIQGPVPTLWTPTIGGTGATLGNGTYFPTNYLQYGLQTFVEITLGFGSTTSLATSGATTFTLPSFLAPYNQIMMEGYLQLWDGGGFFGGGTTYPVQLVQNKLGSLSCTLYTGASNGSQFQNVTETFPAACATNTLLYLRATFNVNV